MCFAGPPPALMPESLPVLANIVKRKIDSNNEPVGRANDNPILDSRIYELEFPDGRIEEYSVNTIIAGR